MPSSFSLNRMPFLRCNGSECFYPFSQMLTVYQSWCQSWNYSSRPASCQVDIPLDGCYYPSPFDIERRSKQQTDLQVNSEKRKQIKWTPQCRNPFNLINVPKNIRSILLYYYHYTVFHSLHGYFECFSYMTKAKSSYKSLTSWLFLFSPISVVIDSGLKYFSESTDEILFCIFFLACLCFFLWNWL